MVSVNGRIPDDTIEVLEPDPRGLETGDDIKNVPPATPTEKAAVSLRLKWALCRFVLPVFLIAAFLLRPSVLSIVYGVLAFVNPLLPEIFVHKVPLMVKIYVSVCGFIPITALVLHAAIQFVSTDAEYFLYCACHFGFFNLKDGRSLVDCLTVLGPEVLVAVVALPIGFCCLFAKTGAPKSQTSAAVARKAQGKANKSDILFSRGRRVGKAVLNWLAGALLLVAAGVHPSLISIPLLLALAVLAVPFALYRRLPRRWFCVVLLFVCATILGYTILLYAYQLPLVQHVIGSGNIPLLMSLYQLYTPRCDLGISSGAVMEVHPEDTFARDVVNPYAIALIGYFYLLVVVIKMNWRRTKMPKSLPRTSELVSTVDPGATVKPTMLPNDDEANLLSSLNLSVTQVSSNQPVDEHNEQNDDTKCADTGRTYPTMVSQQEVDQQHKPQASVLLLIGRLLNFLFYHSYLMTLMSMTMWALVFHSVVSVVWLLVACCIWLLPNTRTFCRLLILPIVGYALALLLLELVIAIIDEQGLISLNNSTNLAQIVGKPIFHESNFDGLQFLVKGALSIPFLVTLRLFSWQKQRMIETPLNVRASIVHQGWVGDQLGAVWVYLVLLLLIWFSVFNSESNVVTIGYWLFCSVFFITLIANFNLFRHMLKVYWLLLLMYILLMLLAIYIYQFDTASSGWLKLTDINITVNSDLGLKSRDVSRLLIFVWPLVLLLVVAGLQLKFFHAIFIRSFDPSFRKTDTPHQSGWWPSLQRSLLRMCNFAMRVAELHTTKIIYIGIMWLVLHEPCFVNVFLVMAAVIGVSLEDYVDRLMSVLSAIVLCCSVTAHLTVRMEFVQQLLIQASYGDVAVNCLTQHSEFYAWIGVPFDDVDNHLAKYKTLILVLMAFRELVRARQRNYRSQHGLRDNKQLFDGANRKSADKDICSMLKFLANYFFYKFGIEICLSVTALVVPLRLHNVHGIHGTVWLLVFSIVQSRSVRRVLWPVYVWCLAIVVCIQYVRCVGWPPGCSSVDGLVNMTKSQNKWERWLREGHQPIKDYFVLLVCFLQLLVAARQLVVFSDEQRARGGGSNKSIFNKDGEWTTIKHNPVPDFCLSKRGRSALDMAKKLVFMYGHFMTLIAVMAVSLLVGRSFFAFGYVVVAFTFLWSCNEFFMQSMRLVHRKCTGLLVYAAVVMLLRAVIQKLGCTFLNALFATQCWFIHLLSIRCFLEENVTTIATEAQTRCPMADTDVYSDIYSDAIVYILMLIQLRILNSWYFQHTIFEFHVQNLLKFRGAHLMGMLMEQTMEAQRQEMQQDVIRIKKHAVRTQVWQLSPDTVYSSARVGGYYHMYTADLKDLEKKHPIPETLDDHPKAHSTVWDHMNLPPDFFNNTYDEVSSEEAFGAFVMPTSVLQHDDRMAKGWNIGDEMPSSIETTESEPSMGLVDDTARTLRVPADVLDPRLQSSETPATSTTQATSEDSTQSFSENSETAVLSPNQVLSRTLSSTDVSKRLSATQLSTSGDAPLSPGLSLCSTQSSAPAEVFDHENVPIKKGPIEEIAPDKTTTLDKLKSFWRCIKRNAKDICLRITNRLGKMTKRHQFVAHVMGKEASVLKKRLIEARDKQKVDVFKCHRIADLDSVFPDEGNTRKSVYCVINAEDVPKYEKNIEERNRKRNTLVLLLSMVKTMAIAYSHIFCYLMVIINHAFSSTLLTLPLPLLTFLWGTLVSPRPPTMFWVVLTGYTQLLITVKFMFRFGVFVWERVDVAVSFSSRHGLLEQLPHIIGITNDSFLFDILLIVALTAHRHKLKLYGLWGNESWLRRRSADLNGASTPLPSETAVEPLKSRFVAWRHKLLHPSYRSFVDLYGYMVFGDALCYSIYLICLSSFIAAEQTDETGATLSWMSDEPISFQYVVVLIVWAVHMVIDRGLYLRKSIIYRLLFHVTVAIVFHLWMFSLPFLNGRSADGWVKAFYCIKCLVLLMSSWQIRNGYPQRRFMRLFKISFNLLNFFIYKAFMFIPFIFEFKTMIDWLCTSTCMTLVDFFQMERIFESIYCLKCTREWDKRDHLRGRHYPLWLKLLIGIPCVAGMLALVFSPIVLYSTLNVYTTAKPPGYMQVNVRIDQWTLYERQWALVQLSDEHFDQLGHIVGDEGGARDYLSRFSRSAVFSATMPSDLCWSVNDESKAALLDYLRLSKEPKLTLTLLFERWDSEFRSQQYINQSTIDNGTLKALVTALDESDYGFSKRGVPLRAPIEGNTTTIDQQGGNGNVDAVMIARPFPNILELPSRSSVRTYNFGADGVAAVELQLRCCDEKLGCSLPSNGSVLGYQQKILVFVQHDLPSWLSFFGAKSVFGLYAAVVFVASTTLRRQLTQMPLNEIFLKQIPDPGYLWDICLDIYFVREAMKFDLEADFYGKLLFLYRDTGTMVQLTRLKNLNFVKNR